MGSPQPGELKRGRTAFRERRWCAALEALQSADEQQDLDAPDLERLAVTAHMLGEISLSDDTWARAHRRWVEVGSEKEAARCVFWCGFGLIVRDQPARAGGWFARTEPADGSPTAYSIAPGALQALFARRLEAAKESFTAMLPLAQRAEDPDLEVLSRLGLGQATIGLGEVTAGLAMLDEAMVAIVAGEVAPLVTGLVYCATIECCHEIWDLDRAREWTAALARWVDEQPELVLYRAECLVHRSQLMGLDGAWSDAMAEIERACVRLTASPGMPGAGTALYQQAELLRLRGDLTAAEDRYRLASQWGHDPQPGLALLRLAQGDASTALAAIRRAVGETCPSAPRATLLAAHVEIEIADGAIEAGRASAEELQALAAAIGVPYLAALAAQSSGSVLLAEGKHRAAVDALRSSWSAWQLLSVPYEGARVRVLLGRALRALGDEASAAMELDAASYVFRELGARADLDALELLLRPDVPARPDGLTDREVEVLTLVAVGMTSRDMAAELVISEKTVARHLSNIYTKLAVSTRAAATAYAFQHGLVR